MHLGLDGRYANWLATYMLIGVETQRIESQFLAIYSSIYGGASMSWSSKRELVVALSTCIAANIDTSLSAYQVVSLMNLINEIVTLKIDNTPAINLAKITTTRGRNEISLLERESKQSNTI